MEITGRMEITVVKEFTFDAAHYLPGYDGPCANLHGHTYKLQIGVKREVDKKTGMVVDFSELKNMVAPELSALDHSCLNEMCLLYFPKHMPTAENIVIWLKNRLSGMITFIQLWETPTSYAEWRSD